MALVEGDVRVARLLDAQAKAAEPFVAVDTAHASTRLDDGARL